MGRWPDRGFCVAGKGLIHLLVMTHCRKNEKKLGLGTSFQEIQSPVGGLGYRAKDYSKSKLYEMLYVNAHVWGFFNNLC